MSETGSRFIAFVLCSGMHCDIGPLEEKFANNFSLQQILINSFGLLFTALENRKDDERSFTQPINMMIFTFSTKASRAENN